ncbi:hypothetical protein ACFLRM_00820 [Acidobacteriota bacterium]
MKSNRAKRPLFLFFLGVYFCIGAFYGNSQEKSAEKDVQKSLIRKDLLLRESRTLKTPRRNIFSPRKSNTIMSVQGEEGFQQSIQGGQAVSENIDLPPVYNLRYIGFINSGQKIVALIIFEDEALAVEKGEILFGGAEVSEITPELIEIITPDSEKRKYSLEGENQ